MLRSLVLAAARGGIRVVPCNPGCSGQRELQLWESRPRRIPTARLASKAWVEGVRGRRGACARGVSLCTCGCVLSYSRGQRSAVSHLRSERGPVCRCRHLVNIAQHHLFTIDRRTPCIHVLSRVRRWPRYAPGKGQCPRTSTHRLRRASMTMSESRSRATSDSSCGLYLGSAPRSARSLT